MGVQFTLPDHWNQAESGFPDWNSAEPLPPFGSLAFGERFWLSLKDNSEPLTKMSRQDRFPVNFREMTSMRFKEIHPPEIRTSPTRQRSLLRKSDNSSPDSGRGESPAQSLPIQMDR